MIVAIRWSVILFVCWVSPAFGGTYWVSPRGSAAWSSCQSVTDPGSNYCSLSIANSSAKAGDTVYLTAGTYSNSSGIAPANSGSSSAKITFTAAPGLSNGQVVILGAQYTSGIEFNGNSWIVVSNITFQTGQSLYFLFIHNSANHDEISNCMFINNGGPTLMGGISLWGCSDGSWACPSSHIWIHDNTFAITAGTTQCNVEPYNQLIFGGSCCPPSGTKVNPNVSNITFENNIVYGGGHHTMDLYTVNSVYRNNKLHNEPWLSCSSCSSCIFPATGYTDTNFNGYYGHRNVQICDDWTGYSVPSPISRPALHNLFEGNRFGYASANPDNGGADNLDLAGPQNITRYNFLFGAMNLGIRFKYGYCASYPNCNGAGGYGGVNNVVYNNTFFNNGYGYPFYYTCNYSICPMEGAAIGNDGQQVGNTVTNNIFWHNNSYAIYGSDAVSRSGGPISHVKLINNWTSRMADPKFVNPLKPGDAGWQFSYYKNVAPPYIPDLALQGSSPVIDGGTYLTTAIGSGSNSTTLVVGSALYFQDGTWGASMSGIQPDWIAIGAVGNVVQISSINYSTNTISLASPMSWNNGASIWLYKKSDGAVVLYGSAPDYGAYEYGSEAQLQAPKNMRTIP